MWFDEGTADFVAVVSFLVSWSGGDGGLVSW